jgi:spermidine synthase
VERRPIRINFFQRVWSYLEPVTLGESTGPNRGRLDLRLVRNQLVLRTEGAIYSEGKRYLPAVTLADHLRSDLPRLKTVLVLGVGIGSIVRVLRARGCYPRYTLVEKDETILGWAMETLVNERRLGPDTLDPVCLDAETFMARNHRVFDLVFVDIFNGRKVPPFATTLPFLHRCRDSLAPGGRMVFNYLVEDQQRWERLQRNLLQVFPDAQIVASRDNRILIGKPIPGSGAPPK